MSEDRSKAAETKMADKLKAEFAERERVREAEEQRRRDAQAFDRKQFTADKQREAKSVDEDRVKNMQKLMYEGGEDAVRKRYGSQAVGSQEFATAQRRSRQAAQCREEFRQKGIKEATDKAAAQSVEKSQQVGQEAATNGAQADKTVRKVVRRKEGAEAGARESKTPIRDAAVAREQARRGLDNPAAQKAQQSQAASPAANKAKSDTPIRDAAVARQRELAAQRQRDRGTARGLSV